MNIGIAGLGLIGGSMAKAIKKYTWHQVYGFDTNEDVMRQALADGNIDGVLDEKSLADCDLLLPALYPAAAVAYIKSCIPYMKKGLVIIDLCGVKKAVMHPVEALKLPEGVLYFGGHPMAGLEKSGYAYAKPDLFKGASMIIVPVKRAQDDAGACTAKKHSEGNGSRDGAASAKLLVPEEASASETEKAEEISREAGTLVAPLKGAEPQVQFLGERSEKPAFKAEDAQAEALRVIEPFFLSLGFANITLTSAEEHDRVIAFTSQLAHVVSSAYVKSPTALKHYGFSAGSYKDLTRVARLNEEMWTELFLDNAESLTEEIDGIISHLRDYREAIASHKRAELRELLRVGRERKEHIDTFENS